MFLYINFVTGIFKCARATVLTDEKDQLNLMLSNAALIPTRQHIHIGFHFSLLLNVRPKTNKNGFVLMFSCQRIL